MAEFQIETPPPYFLLRALFFMEIHVPALSFSFGYEKGGPMNTRISRKLAIFASFVLLVSALALGQNQRSNPNDDTTPDPPPVQKLDINTANRAQLMRLGLTEAVSLQIIANRPYIA